MDLRLSPGSFYGKLSKGCEISGLGLAEIVYPPKHKTCEQAHERAYFSLTLQGGYTKLYGRQRVECTPETLVFHPPDQKQSGYCETGGRSFIIEIAPQVLDRFEHPSFTLERLTISRGGTLTWQFLGAERPLRNGMHYYYSIQEKVKGDPTEAFGIYGNMNSGYGSASVSLYGNQRQGLNFITIEKPQLKEWFGMDDSEDVWRFKQKLVEEFLRLSSNADDALSEQHKKGFEKLDFIENGKLAVPIFHKGDQMKLAEIAGLITDELIRLLEKHRSELEKSYRESAYSQEVSFEEYGIWWYHFFYTGVTEKLIAKRYITRPATGVFTYLNSQ